MRIGKCVLIYGDCFEVLKSIRVRSIGTVLSDPPYDSFTAAARAGRGKNRPHRSIADYSIAESAFHVWFQEVGRSLRPDGRAFIFCDGQSLPVIARTARWHFADDGVLVWNKVRLATGYEFRKVHELIFWATRKATRKVPHSSQRDIITCSAVPPTRRLHQSQKPVELLNVLLSYCDKSRLVLDPFMGTGSTIEAAMRAGFPAIGIELDRVVYDKAVNRIKQVYADLSK